MMSFPSLHDVSFINSVFHEAPLSGVWKIPSSKSDDVIWNIVLAYLNSFPPSNEQELGRRIRSLAGCQTVTENIKNSIKICNPFMHRNACFCDEAMSALVDAFKNKVNDYIKSDQFQSLNQNSKHLEASSRLLACNIVAISFPIQNLTSVHIFPLSYVPNPPINFAQDILLFYEPILMNRDVNLGVKFSYCVPKEVGVQKQREALEEILKRITVLHKNEKIVQKICRLPDIGDNFIISLLKNDFGHIIPFIYKSPYVLSKLADAGFETDPRTKDVEGISALRHALMKENFRLVSLLYDHAANACLQTEASVRTPDLEIVENLVCLRNDLKQLEKDLESIKISEKCRCFFQDLCRFNEFQIEICKSVNNITPGKNYYDQSEKKYEASQRKETILTILKTYENYFHYVNGEPETSLDEVDNISRFKDFYKHRDYFDKLDFSSALIFFDNLFRLKERLKLPNNEYLDVESNFFLYIFCRKYLEKYEKEDYFYFFSRWITFQERLSLKRHLCCFKTTLENTELSVDNVVGKLPDAALRTLTNLPQIYGQFLVIRLQHYLDASTGITVKDLKSILIIERCLQVIGECCKESDFNSVQNIISLALPKDLIKHLKQIRNRVAHIKPHELLYRYNLEQDVELFIGIQKELAQLNKFLVPIYSAHKYEMDQFLLLHSVKSICKARRRSILKVHENQLKAILPSPESEENQHALSTLSCQNPWKRYFDDMHISLGNEIKDLNCNGNIINKNTIRNYKHIIQNMIIGIKELLKNLKVKIPYKDVEKLNRDFWCLESILTYITKDRNLLEYRRALVLLVKDRKTLFTRFKENSFQFRKKDESIVDKAPVSDIEIGEKQQSSQLEGNRGTCQRNDNTVHTFVKYSVLFNTVSGSSTFTNENVDNGSSEKIAEISETNQVETETKRESFENSFLQNMFHDSLLGENIATVESNLCENSEDYPKILLTQENDSAEAIDVTSRDQKVLLTEENYFAEATDVASRDQRILLTQENDFAEAISVTSPDYWLLSNVFNVYQDYQIKNEVEDPAEIIGSKNNKNKMSKCNAFVEQAATILDNYKVISCDIFQKIPEQRGENEEFHFESIEKYCLILKGLTILKNEEKEILFKSVPKRLQNIPELKQSVKDLLSEKCEFTEEVQVKLSELNMKNQEIKEIRENIEFGLIDDANRIIDSARDYFLDLKVMMESKEIDKKECELACKKLKIPDNAKDILLKLAPGQNKKVPGNKFEFLRNRIKMLKNILIDDNNGVQQLWERATTPRRKIHVKEKIVLLFLNNSEIQASVETLLFDCMTILSSTELKNLWKKTTNLFNGINLRNVLAHGHPLLESLGKLLDPCDLPSELVARMLKLISDEYVIDCMQQILEQSQTDISGFMQIMNDKENEQFKDLREQIMQCDSWKEYASLIPLN